MSLIYEMQRCFVSGQFDSKRTMLMKPNKGTFQIHFIHYDIYIYYCLLLPSDETEYEYSGSEEEEEEASEQEGEPR